MRVKLVASMIVRNERGRYLEPCVQHLQEFCDEIRVVDDGSTDGTADYLAEQGCFVWSNPRSTFYEHEGRARQQLLEWTLDAQPTHVLAIDADEFVEDGARLRQQLGREIVAHTLCMQEVWAAGETLKIRMDGGWKPHPVPICWAVPINRAALRIQDRALACGREPLDVRRMRQRPTGVCVLHFGWANPAEREARYQRYVEADGGKFHASRHLQSIMWPDAKVQLCEQEWPEAIAAALREADATITTDG